MKVTKLFFVVSAIVSLSLMTSCKSQKGYGCGYWSAVDSNVSDARSTDYIFVGDLEDQHSFVCD